MKAKVAKWFVVVGVLAGFAVLFLLMERVPPGTNTLGRMLKLRLLIQDCAAEYSGLPGNLEKVAAFASETNREFRPEWTKDEWGNPIIYRIHSPNEITLESLGRDATAGGKGTSADIMVRVPVTTNNKIGNRMDPNLP
jgi:hypothetical protein